MSKQEQSISQLGKKKEEGKKKLNQRSMLELSISFNFQLEVL